MELKKYLEEILELDEFDRDKILPSVVYMLENFVHRSDVQNQVEKLEILVLFSHSLNKAYSERSRLASEYREKLNGMFFDLDIKEENASTDSSKESARIFNLIQQSIKQMKEQYEEQEKKLLDALELGENVFDSVIDSIEYNISTRIDWSIDEFVDNWIGFGEEVWDDKFYRIKDCKETLNKFDFERYDDPKGFWNFERHQRVETELKKLIELLK